MCTRVLALLALLLGVAHCFNWDIVVGKEKALEFYTNGTLTHTEEIPSATHIDSVTYDPVHYRVMFVDNKDPKISIFSFDLLTKQIEHLVTTKKNPTGSHTRIAYDPVTASLFWKQNSNIHSFSLYPACSKKVNDATILLSSNEFAYDIAVDSCGGYIYWITCYKIERARFDGSEREVLIDSTVSERQSLAIDQQTRRLYWIEKSGAQIYIESADLNGQNRMTVYIVKNDPNPSSLTVSNDFIYWKSTNQKIIWQLPKNQHVEPKLFLNIDRASYSWVYQIVAANYTIEGQTQGYQNCENIKRLIPESLFCVHGTKVSGESRCECAQGYSGVRCDVSICHNYCLQGDCSVSAEGQPKCRCNAGYAGVRCEVNACYKHCLHNGVCSLNEADDPVCECSTDYEGETCEVATTQTSVHTDKTIKDLLRNLRVFSYKQYEYEIKV